jgi:hypothetical protein
MKKLVLSALALTLSGAGLVATTTAAHADPIPAPIGADMAPSLDAGNYLAAQPVNGIIKTYYDFPVGPPFESYDDYGLTIDAAWALDAVGGHFLIRQQMTTALEANIANYAFSGGTKSKIAAYLLSQGIDNGATEDLVADVEDNHLGDAAPIVGRLIDADDPGTVYDDDFNSPLTQAFAVSALNNGGSDQAKAVLDFLLDQQCTEGFFRSSFSAKADLDQTCDGEAAPTASVDTTATVLLMLQDQKSKPKVKAAISQAMAWLGSTQDTDGSWGGNANATGLAGWALGLADPGFYTSARSSAVRAAYWLRTHQLANAGDCHPFAAADDGAVVLDDLGYTNAQSGALDELDTSVAVRATTQAAPALMFAPGQGAAQGVRSGETTLTGPEGFVPAGSTQQVSLAGAPGNTVCVMPEWTTSTTGVVLDADGRATVPVATRPVTGSTNVATTDAGDENDLVTIDYLAKTVIDVKAKSAVKQGAQLVVSLTGLAAGEKVTVTFGGKTAKATAKANGKVKVKLIAARLGKQKVKVVGEFANRKGKATVTVTA